jgi:mRNA interferase RelE/StbE
VGDYDLLIKGSAAKELRAILSTKDQQRIIGRIRGLAREPRPQGAHKLAGSERYRIRQGDYRIVYGIDDAERTIQVVKIGHRRDVYR